MCRHAQLNLSAKQPGLTVYFWQTAVQKPTKAQLSWLANTATAKNDGKYRIITAVHSFHGRTMMTVTATGQPKYQQGYEPLPAGFDYVPYGDLEALKEAMDEDVCCVMLEPIQGEGGCACAK